MQDSADRIYLIFAVTEADRNPAHETSPSLTSCRSPRGSEAWCDSKASVEAALRASACGLARLAPSPRSHHHGPVRLHPTCRPASTDQSLNLRFELAVQFLKGVYVQVGQTVVRPLAGMLDADLLAFAGGKLRRAFKLPVHHDRVVVAQRGH